MIVAGSSVIALGNAILVLQWNGLSAPNHAAHRFNQLG